MWTPEGNCVSCSAWDSDKTSLEIRPYHGYCTTHGRHCNRYSTCPEYEEMTPESQVVSDSDIWYREEQVNPLTWRHYDADSGVTTTSPDESFPIGDCKDCEFCHHLVNNSDTISCKKYSRLISKDDQYDNKCFMEKGK